MKASGWKKHSQGQTYRLVQRNASGEQLGYFHLVVFVAAWAASLALHVHPSAKIAGPTGWARKVQMRKGKKITPKRKFVCILAGLEMGRKFCQCCLGTAPGVINLKPGARVRRFLCCNARVG